MTFFRTLNSLFQNSNDFIIKNQNQSATNGSQNISKIAFKKCFASFVFNDLFPTIHGSFVHFFTFSGHHHESSTDGVEGVGDADGPGGDRLSDCEFGQKCGIVHHLLCSIVGSEINCSENKYLFSNWFSETRLKFCI